MRRAARVDANHTAVMTALGGMGCSVQSLANQGGGVPDLLVGYRGQTFLVEVKDGKKAPSRRKLTDDQGKWHAWWRGSPVYVVHSPDEALAVVCGIPMEPTEHWTGWREAMGDI